MLGHGSDEHGLAGSDSSPWVEIPNSHPPPTPSHCAPCNTFGEQREIYEWIGLFRGALFFLQGGAFIYSGGHFLGLEKSTAKSRGA